MEKRIIDSLHSETTGWVYRANGEITEISKNGEMAAVPWYLYKPNDSNREVEINGKYVTILQYELIDTPGKVHLV